MDVICAPLDACEAVPAAVATLADSERQPCEVWTRVMGYHRPAASFNTGKKGEYEERAYFQEPHGCTCR